MELRELSAFVAVVEEGGMSAAARRLHMSQSALSQTVSGLEREIGVQTVRTMGSYSTEAGGAIRLGIPLELAPDVLPRGSPSSGSSPQKHA
jgi:DNA-binding transcriptional regulator YdaS (Cro superfamily)